MTNAVSKLLKPGEANPLPAGYAQWFLDLQRKHQQERHRSEEEGVCSGGTTSDSDSDSSSGSSSGVEEECECEPEDEDAGYRSPTEAELESLQAWAEKLGESKEGKGIRATIRALREHRLVSTTLVGEPDEESDGEGDGEGDILDYEKGFDEDDYDPLDRLQDLVADAVAEQALRENAAGPQEEEKPKKPKRKPRPFNHPRYGKLAGSCWQAQTPVRVG